MQLARFLFSVLVCATAWQVQADSPIYRYQTADGKVIYSNQAPVDTKLAAPAKVLDIPLSPAPSPEEVKQMRANISAEYERVTARMDAREREFEKTWLAAQQARAKSEQLALERERQREALAGQRVHIIRGYSPVYGSPYPYSAAPYPYGHHRQWQVAQQHTVRGPQLAIRIR